MAATTAQINAHTTTPNAKTTPSKFYADLEKHHVAPLWLSLPALLTKTPRPSAVPTLWRYKDLRPQVIKSGEVITAEEAEKRVLMLLNPALEGQFATDSIYSGLQLILPHETAPAHRHSPFALRYIIEGRGGFTAVAGKKLMMEPGDVILTPSGSWHDHGNEGEEPVIWLDGLDLPVFRFLALGFTEQYSKPRMSSDLADAVNVLRFPWAPVEEALKPLPGPHATYHYSDAHGEPLSRTLGAQAERVAAGEKSAISRQTISYVYHVVKGDGCTVIKSPLGEKEQKFEWQKGDTFAVPAWSLVQHKAAENDAYLFAINDRPLIEALGLIREAVV